ncbi:MAG: hypothetical protein CMJ78_14690 [Planctomycetaceae bacterium]|nr:hypothetical protein [Planctomycetaceae bacterium]
MVLINSASAIDVELRREKPVLKIGPAFKQQLQTPISASWGTASDAQTDSFSLRHIVKRVSDGWDISLLVDRRVDPDQEVAIELVRRPLIDGVREIAGQAKSEISVIGNVIYLAPADSARVIRTLVQLRTNQLAELSSAKSRSRRLKLSQRRDIHWNDLDTPAGILDQITERYELQIEGREQIRHDLWAGATLPSATATEALSLLLAQFGMTFQWSADADSIRLMPIPETVTIQRSYRLKSGRATTTVRIWKEKIPGIQTSVKASEIVVRGTLEQHEAIDELRNPSSAPSKPVGKSIDLSRQRFTLKVSKAPASAILKRLEQSGIRLKYDAAALKAAGANLDQNVSIDVKQADANELFRQIIEPLGLKYKVTKTSVSISAK